MLSIYRSYIKIKANGDKALALAMGQIIIKNKLYDEKISYN